MSNAVDPISTQNHAFLVFSNPGTTSTHLYMSSAKDRSSQELVPHALYVVSEQSKYGRVAVRRGLNGSDELVAELQYGRNKCISVQFIHSGVQKTVKYAKWVTRASHGSGKHQMMIGGQAHTWTETKEGKSVVNYPVCIFNLLYLGLNSSSPTAFERRRGCCSLCTSENPRSGPWICGEHCDPCPY